ncbi:MAG: hypothetical protein JXB32_17020 [Deltaproteobacteria bacterium]|nr:hypothetical protein [Deltaproteobacteria bacterium]
MGRGIASLSLSLSLLLAAGVAEADRGAAPGVATLPAEPPAGLSVHEWELRRHADEPLLPRIVPSEEVLRRGAVKAVDRIVYGYYPYWVRDLTTIRWSALTHLAWFSLEMDATGAITAAHGWPDTATVEAAHAAGVRVDLAVTLFSSSGIGTLCASAANRARAIGNLVDRMQAGNADGIAIDFEGVPGSAREGYTTFIRELRAELTRRGLTDAGLSIAGPAVDWGGAFDLDVLLDHIDSYFIMGYDFFWSGSGHAGPTGILRTTADWRPFTSWAALRSIATYTGLVDAAKRRKIVYGVPYYGREWTTVDDSMGAATIANIGSVTYSEAREAVGTTRTRRWHEGIKTPWYVWNGGGWHEVYYDDEESLEVKYWLARAQDLGGVGMWALNYDAPHAELWDLLETMFAGEPDPPAGHRHNPLPIADFPFHDARNTAEGPSHYFNFYSCDASLAEWGREWVYAVDVCRPGTLTAHVPEYASVDPDLHLLSAATEDTCLARAHTDLSQHIDAGRYLLTVDTYVDNAVELEGPYELDVDFAADPGTTGCAAHLVCVGGECVCADPALTDCGTACVDTSSDPDHCGGCDTACDPGESCAAGTCVPGAADADADADVSEDDAGADDAGADADQDVADDVPADGSPDVIYVHVDDGCGCRAAGGARPADALLLGLLLVVAARRRRRS